MWRFDRVSAPGGFSLVELLIVLALVAFTAALVGPQAVRVHRAVDRRLERLAGSWAGPTASFAAFVRETPCRVLADGEALRVQASDGGWDLHLFAKGGRVLDGTTYDAHGNRSAP
ncbi:prepilin-type N-terminal cleavage/methylation domain-containing protein [Deferrisoma palaeochoriense]